MILEAGDWRFRVDVEKTRDRTSKYSFEYIRITADNTDLLKEACEKLYDPESGLDLADEHIAINELIENFSALGLAAGVIVCDGKPVAYSIGEHMSDDVALIHIEKADKNFSGSFATINKTFADASVDNDGTRGETLTQILNLLEVL